MAEIKIIYEQGYCVAADESRGRNVEDYYCEACYTEFSENLGCPYYSGPRSWKEEGENGHVYGVISFSPCNNAASYVKHKGISAKQYEAYIDENPYKLGEDCAVLEIGKHKYICQKLIIDGEQIFPEEEVEL